MNNATPAKNKALVLIACDTLFNKRDYVAAERYESPNYASSIARILSLVARIFFQSD